MNARHTAVLYGVLISVISIICTGIGRADVLTLGQGLQLAAENNRQIKITQKEESISYFDTLIARSALLPSVTTYLNQTFLAFQPGAIFGQQTVPTSEKSFFSYSLGVQQLLYDFEGAASRYGASKMVLETKKFDTSRIRNFVLLNFALQYFELLESEKMVAVAVREVERLEAHLRDARSLYENGVITKNDLLQADVRLADARQRLLSARNFTATSRSRLNNLIARPLSVQTHVEDVSEAPSAASDLDMPMAWDTALELRPEMRIVDRTMSSLNLEETARLSDYYPHFFAQGSYDYTENRFLVHQGNWAFTLGMSLNIFSGGSTKAEVAKVRYRKQQLLEQKAKLEDEIRLEVEKYILDLKNARDRLRVAKDAIGQAEENLRINRVRYGEGVGTATEVLDAVTLLTVTETNYYRSLYDVKRAEAGAFYSIGKDLLEVYQ